MGDVAQVGGKVVRRVLGTGQDEAPAWQGSRAGEIPALRAYLDAWSEQVV
jgi:hypothetical protein